MKIVEKEKSHFYWWSNFHNVKWNLRSVKHTVVYFFPLLSPHVFVLIVDKHSTCNWGKTYKLCFVIGLLIKAYNI